MAATAPAAHRPAATALFTALVDDAGLFPPTALPVPAALARHRRDRADANPVHSGWFLCSAADLGAVLALVRPDDDLRLSVVCPPDAHAVTAALRSVAGVPGARIVAVEHPLPAPASGVGVAPGATPTGVGRFVELTPDRCTPDVLDQVRATAAAVKVRCGGARAELFPSAAALAALLVACVDAGVPVKATAGLHDAVRHRDPATGLLHHGFLNLLMAVAARLAGGPVAAVADVLRETNRHRLADAARALTPSEAAAVRRVFTSYGSCDTAAPVAGLARLGLIDGDDAGLAGTAQ